MDKTLEKQKIAKKAIYLFKKFARKKKDFGKNIKSYHSH